jgi:hypothetical protein
MRKLTLDLDGAAAQAAEAKPKRRKEQLEAMRDAGGINKPKWRKVKGKWQSITTDEPFNDGPHVRPLAFQVKLESVLRAAVPGDNDYLTGMVTFAGTKFHTDAVRVTRQDGSRATQGKYQGHVNRLIANAQARGDHSTMPSTICIDGRHYLLFVYPSLADEQQVAGKLSAEIRAARAANTGDDYLL